MTPLRLTTWFRKRMLIVVVLAMGTAWVTLTAGSYAQAHRESVLLCRGEAAHIGGMVAEAIRQRPLLWRYDSAKLADRILELSAAERSSIVVRDSLHAPVVTVGPPLTPTRAIWGRSDVLVGGEVKARVWVGQDAAPLRWRSLAVASISALVAFLLGALLFFLPVRTIRIGERRIASLLSQLAVSWREEERLRIANELHDGAGQALTAARLHLSALKRHATPEVAERLLPITTHIDEAIEEVRRSTCALVPPALADLGLRGAIERHCEAFAGASGLAISCDIDPSIPSAGSHVETACYRIVQEALTNVARHAQADRVSVRLELSEDALHLCVEDDGTGMATREASTEGVGLASIRARAESLGGELSIHSSSAGTRLDVVLPLPPAAD
ncbi:MAG TPA: sensor histidine kinase [Polyangiaceae bacterium]|nr:sensor histidine kinase [Polyangiaceae bacterium]